MQIMTLKITQNRVDFTQLAASFVVWLLFMLHYRREARLMNERIQELKKASKKNP